MTSSEFMYVFAVLLPFCSEGDTLNLQESWHLLFHPLEVVVRGSETQLQVVKCGFYIIINVSSGLEIRKSEHFCLIIYSKLSSGDNQSNSNI